MKYPLSNILQSLFLGALIIFLLFWIPNYFSSRKILQIPQNIQVASGSLFSAAQGDFKLYSPPNGDVETDMVRTLDSSKKRIWLSVYILTNKEIIAALKRAKNRGIDVRIILEGSVYQQPKIHVKTISELKSVGIPISFASHRKIVFMHAKFIIIDNDFWLGTGNFSYSSFHENREFYLFGRNFSDIQYLEDIFLSDASGMQFSKKNSYFSVSPIDSREKIEDFLSSAKKEILVFQQTFTDPRMIQNIKFLSHKGISIELCIGDTKKIEKNKDAMNDLQAYGIRVIAPKKPYIHAKAILLDKSLIFIGSTNFSTNALDNNREIGIFLQDEGLVKIFLQAFNQECRAKSPRKQN